jgi:hypothetical protein
MFAIIALSVAVAGAAPVNIDLNALNAGQLPAAGTREEADACAVETHYTLLDMLKTGKAQQAADKVPPMVEWQKRAAAFRDMTAGAYSNDPAFVDAVNAVDAVAAPAHVALEAACIERLRATAG